MTTKKAHDKVETKADPKPKADKREVLLFAGVKGYSLGGIHDLRFRGTLDEAKAHFDAHVGDYRGLAPHGTDTWAHIVDAKTLEVIDQRNVSVNSWQETGWAVAPVVEAE